MNKREAHMDKPTRHLDATGLLCPEPLMLLRNQVREMSIGERIEITATDPTTHRDFSDYCRFLGHELVHYSQQDELHKFVVEKRGS